MNTKEQFPQNNLSEEEAERLVLEKTDEKIHPDQHQEEVIDEIARSKHTANMQKLKDAIEEEWKNDSTLGGPEDAFPDDEHTLMKKYEPRTPIEHINQEVEESKPTNEKKGLGNFFKKLFGKPAIVAGLAASSMTAQGATNHNTNPTDSTKNKIEIGIKKESKETITNQLRNDWNNYVQWLESKHLKGDASLDHNGKGIQMLLEYIKEHPGTSLSVDKVDDIQEEFRRYREWSLAEIKSGRSAFGTGVTEQNYMARLSDADGIPGQYTTQHSFPESYLKTFVNGKLTESMNTGFATTNKKDTKTVNYNDIATNK